MEQQRSGRRAGGAGGVFMALPAVLWCIWEYFGNLKMTTGFRQKLGNPRQYWLLLVGDTGIEPVTPAV